MTVRLIGQLVVKLMKNKLFRFIVLFFHGQIVQIKVNFFRIRVYNQKITFDFYSDLPLP